MRVPCSLSALCLLAAACGGSDSAGPQPPRASSVTISPDSAGVVLYDSLSLHATARDAAGNALTGIVPTWSSSASGIVWVRSNGTVQSLARGSATITATIEGVVRGTAKIVVVVPINLIQLNPAGALLSVGDTVRIQPTLFTMDGLPPTDSSLTWTSGDTAIAIVAQGLVTARGVGSTTVTAAATLAQASAAVTVVP